MHYHQQNKIYILKNKLNHKIEDQLKGIEFDDEDEKLKVYNKQFQIKQLENGEQNTYVYPFI
jgi:hypothetical protein